MFLAELPLTSVGKIGQKQLRAAFRKGRAIQPRAAGRRGGASRDAHAAIGVLRGRHRAGSANRDGGRGPAPLGLRKPVGDRIHRRRMGAQTQVARADHNVLRVMVTHFVTAMPGDDAVAAAPDEVMGAGGAFSKGK